jgi:tetratricopeptide (TPR) repeat protein
MLAAPASPVAGAGVGGAPNVGLGGLGNVAPANAPSARRALSGRAAPQQPAPVADGENEAFDVFRARKAQHQREALDRAGGRTEQAAESMKGDSAKKEAKQADEAEKDNKRAADKTRVWRRQGGRPTIARVYIGDGNSLDLVSLDVSVTVEGPRARTVVDHVFRNPHGRQLEGTFEYPLPSGASPSYFAMFLGQTRQAVPPRFARRGADAPPVPATALAVLSPELMVRNVDTADWGRLQEARVVGKDKALETYEDVVRGRVDPALLEYASGNTFRGRVFPIAPGGYNRVVLAYEELLPVSEGKMVYRFALPDRQLAALHFTLNASEADCREREFVPAGHSVQEAAGRVYYARNWADDVPADPEVLFACTPSRPEVQAVTGRQGENGPSYVYARVRPELPRVAADRGAAAHAIFLLDTSLSEQGARFGVSMKLMRAILEGDPAIKQFNVLAFNAAATWVEPKGWLPNTPQGRETLFQRLDGIVLEGATDVGAALDRLAEPPAGLPDKAPVDCFLLSDGHATWGETEVGTLVARFEARCPFAPRFHCYLTGLGAENAELFEALTRRGGGVFGCRSDADVAAAAAAHRSQCLRVEKVHFVGGPAASDVLVAGRRAAVYPGGELVVAARFPSAGRTTLLVEGTFAGQPFAQEYPVEVKDGGELAPRGWAEVAVASLLALNDPKLDSLVTAYCQQFNIGSRVASFLVLENEADYKRFNLEAERGKTVAGDLGSFLDRMWESLARVVSPRQEFLRFLDRVEGRANLLPGDARLRVRKLVSLMGDKEFELPAASLAGAVLHTSDVPPEYLASRAADPRDASPYLAEARRRASAGDTDGAVRVLSSIIEEHPSRGDALRLVGYRLLDLKQPAQAARLFERVQRQRPFEPHSYRDLARALEETGNLALAAVQYEIVLGSVWHNRFGDSLKQVVQEEYTLLMRDALRRRAVGPALANYFGDRLEGLSAHQPGADLRITISWNTDATDVDLWVIEPDGTKCFYQHNRTQSGGELSADQTQGYGPERYQVVKALKGKYRVLVHYFNNNPNLLAGETHVNVVVTRFAGSDHEQTERHTVILRKKGEEAEVCEVEF